MLFSKGFRLKGTAKTEFEPGSLITFAPPLIDGVYVPIGNAFHFFKIKFSLSDKYPWERYEPPYPPSYGLNSTTAVLLEE